MTHVKISSAYIRCTAVALLMVAHCACSPAPQGESGAIQVESSAAHVTPTPIPLAEVKLSTVDGSGYQAALDQLRGQVVLVDFWATWCEPCTENFPHIVALARQHEAAGLRVVGFSCNEPSEAGAVRQFLADQGAAFDNLLTKFGNGTQTNDTFDVRGVPQYKLYDRRGTLRFQFAEAYDDLEHGEPMENLDRRIAELLAERP